MSHAVPTAVTPHRTATPERPLRVRVAAVYAVVVALHVLAAALSLKQIYEPTTTNGTYVMPSSSI